MSNTTLPSSPACGGSPEQSEGKGEVVRNTPLSLALRARQLPRKRGST